MIADLIIYLFWGIIKLLMQVLPSMAVLPQGFTDAWDFFATQISYFFYIIPASDTITTIMGLFLLFELAMFLFKSIEKIYSWIPFKAT